MAELIYEMGVVAITVDPGAEDIVEFALPGDPELVEDAVVIEAAAEPAGIDNEKATELAPEPEEDPDAAPEPSETSQPIPAFEPLGETGDAEMELPKANGNGVTISDFELDDQEALEVKRKDVSESSLLNAAGAGNFHLAVEQFAVLSGHSADQVEAHLRSGNTRWIARTCKKMRCSNLTREALISLSALAVRGVVRTPPAGAITANPLSPRNRACPRRLPPDRAAHPAHAWRHGSPARS
jgi:hypothetical protein